MGIYPQFIFEYLVDALMEAKQSRLHATMRGMNLDSRLRDAVDRIITLFVCPVSYVVHIAADLVY